MQTTITNQRGLVAQQLRFYRKQAGLTQAKLAAQLGVTVSAVAKWESGKHSTPILLIHLADMTAYDLELDDGDNEATA